MLIGNDSRRGLTVARAMASLADRSEGLCSPGDNVGGWMGSFGWRLSGLASMALLVSDRLRLAAHMADAEMSAVVRVAV